VYDQTQGSGAVFSYFTDNSIMSCILDSCRQQLHENIFKLVTNYIIIIISRISK
jgi:hypothetical protein